MEYGIIQFTKEFLTEFTVKHNIYSTHNIKESEKRFHVCINYLKDIVCE